MIIKINEIRKDVTQILRDSRDLMESPDTVSTARLSRKVFPSEPVSVTSMFPNLLISPLFVFRV